MVFNKSFIFLCISLCFLTFSLIAIFTAPFINNINDNISKFSNWGKLNCKFYSDQEKEIEHIDEMHKLKKSKYLCYRQKAAYNLEYASLTINIILGIICTQLGLLVYFNTLNSITKISGIFGLITGIICFILTLVYICFSGYIFNNDTAFKILKPGYSDDESNQVEKLFSNGGSWKWIDNDKYVTVYEGDESDDAKFIKYKDLGEKQYNYNEQFYKARIRTSSECLIPTGSPPFTRPVYGPNNEPCQYSYKNTPPEYSISYKYLYDNWITTIILSCFIILCGIGLGIFGFLLFKKKNESDGNLTNTEPINIINK